MEQENPSLSELVLCNLFLREPIINNMETKVCPKCKIEKHKSEFHLKKKGEIKLAYCCKKCKQEIDNEYRLKNVDNLKIVKKNYVLNANFL